MFANDLRRLYRESTGKPWSPEEGAKWLTLNFERYDIYFKRPVLDKTAHTTLADKANWLSHQRCHVCREPETISTMPIRIAPESWQALKSVDKKAFKAAVAERLKNRPGDKPFEGRVCLTFVFVCSSKRRIRDLDNMAKLLMDSLKGIIMGDDRNVDHLNLMRLTHGEDEEFVTIRIRSSSLNDHSDVAAKILNLSWDREPLRLKDFRKKSK